MAHIDILGAEMLKAQLMGLTSAMESERSSAALAACHVFERRAKWYASGHGGGPGRVTGNLNNSIQSRKTAADEAQCAPSMDYAAFVEYGTSRMHAFPYMRPAWESGKEEAEMVLKERLGAVVSLRAVASAQMGASFETSGYETYDKALPED